LEVDCSQFNIFISPLLKKIYFNILSCDIEEKKKKFLRAKNGRFVGVLTQNISQFKPERFPVLRKRKEIILRKKYTSGQGQRSFYMQRLLQF
jgi:hypothetical protein